MDGYFEIKEMEDGMYIEVVSPTEDGNKVTIGEITTKLQERNIEYNITSITDALENIDHQPLFKISELSELKEEEVVEEIVEKNFNLYVSDDQMKLIVKFFPTKNHNKVELNLQAILEDASKMKISVPINDKLLLELADEIEFHRDYIIAVGITPVPSKEAEIQYHFKTDKDFRPEVDEEGNVNYHKLHVIANVKKDQVLATLIPSFEGISGMNVFGTEIKPNKPKVVKLKRGKNVGMNSDFTELFSESDGLVKLEDDKVSVYNSYDIPGNVGSSTGDVEFQGSIVVSGNVMTGFKLVATGDIEVLGVVEGAIVEAGGNILLHRGIQGMNRSRIQAGGNVIARYIENGEVIAGGMVHSEAILHSQVSAKEEIKVEGKKGMITGGTVRSGTEISANILGSHMGTATNIEVGIDPLIWDEYNDLNKEYPKLLSDAEKIEQVMALLNKRKEIDGELDEQKKEMYISATRNKIILSNKISKSEKRIEELKHEVERRNDGKIKVRNIVYPGVRITIGTAKYFVRDEIKYVLMQKDGADVKLSSL
ncbi:MAG: hypothetical protein CVU84_02735 [Firmicutes bacterium HGW-Firmicutes-1]|jgi:hypothetical protein|nr:MAG: hypothetical protein CVU84_02735 [Firmicutes bacterium HGW-Firmicutes-1]